MWHCVHVSSLYSFDEYKDNGVLFIVIIAYRGSDPSKNPALL
ncbi:hypothetical protein VCRA2126O85_160045 [Vibrio crassostreae]|nr:hypothetical protein VCRA2128O106_150046 [Vibrio crassostreae]CAK2644921.1 hypothetical protein VCRA2125O83_150045 [Vibrio crassostreae]CAK2649556.1 hypothetical protein VCRA2128O100_160048 [Vibrio crassostreae]CAK2652409.1 hypothetical protein VCRA2126O84_160046 [Vibrio crassostreae]CAK2654228.1 hypothetical protein VCRA2127O91_160046 [Vibrio crassostreae]